MYTLGLHKTFIAQHYLISEDAGPEHHRHSHPYQLDVRVAGDSLDQQGYLIDITVLEDLLDRIVAQYQDATLNDLEAFQGLNPSLEHFARIIAQQILEELSTGPLRRLEVRLWEDPDTWAEYRQDLSG